MQGLGQESKSSERKRRKPHAGAHRPLHANPTAKRDVFAASCQHCGALFLDTPQFVCEAYDHIEIPSIIPHVTRVSLLGGACQCCARTFKAEPPQDMPKGSPFGPNLRALVIYLRFTQGIAFERLSTSCPISSVSTSARARSSTCSTRRGPVSQRRPPRSAPGSRRNDPAIRRDRPAGWQAELVAVGLPS